MGLRDRLTRSPDGAHGEKPRTPANDKQGEPFQRRASYQQIKLTIHRLLIECIDSTQLSIVDSPASRMQIRAIAEGLLQQENPPLNSKERQQLLQDLEDETLGLGPLESLLRDPTISDILVNRHDEVYVERAGRLEKTTVTFRDDTHLRQVIDRIVGRVGRRIDESSPMVDARLPDGSRINAIIPPLAVDGPSLSIRRFHHNLLLMDDLLRLGSLSVQADQLLKTAVEARLNIVISGGTGAGKTTLLNAMIRYVGETERLISVEDTVELRPQGLHCIRLETRPPNIEGNGEISQRNLVKNVLRMRPDRIVIGEVRGAEAYDMIQAMNTGHKGCFTTIHANSPRDALARLETMILMAGVNLTSEAMRRQIGSAIDLVVQIQRFPDGIRRIVSVSEVRGLEEQMIKLQEIFKFQYSRTAAPNSIRGEYVFTGIVPAFIEELHNVGIPIPKQIFNQTHQTEP
ncbi:MAG: CpaF family protein [Candidatus Omnitrophica bacterium]|nr:CpaF family protein [Candidatus Omnitrophota bacterium]